MNKPVIIVAPQGAGKSLNAEQLLASLGCGRLVDGWDGASPLRPGDLALTNLESFAGAVGARVMSLSDALEWAAPAA